MAMRETGRLDDSMLRCAGYYEAFTASAAAAMTGPDQPLWLDRPAREYDNIRAVLRWALDTGRFTAALRLAATTVDRLRSDAGPTQLPGDALCPATGAGEHDRRGGRRDHFRRHPYPVLAGDGPEVVGGIARVVGVGNFVTKGLVLVAAGQLGDFPVERRREQQRLAGRGGLVEEPADLGHEPHVGHPVGFVDYDEVDVGQRDRAFLDEVGESAGRGDEDIDTPPKLASLVVV
ncbi:MAG: hypothetical protein FWJ83_06100, partial [Limnochordales bacterium]